MRVIVIDQCNDAGELTLHAVVEKPVGKSRNDVFLAWYQRKVRDNATLDQVTQDGPEFAGYEWQEVELTEWKTI